MGNNFTIYSRVEIEKKNIQGEEKTLRGHVYFNFCNYFKHTEKRTTDNSKIKCPRSKKGRDI